MYDGNKQSIIKKIEDNFSDFFIDVTQVTNGELHVSNNYKWVKGRNNTWPSGIFDFRMDKDDFDKKLIDIVIKMQVGILPGLIMTGPLTQPQNYDYYLKKHRLHKKSEAIGMALKISDIKTDFEVVKNLNIIMLSGDDYLYEWSRIVCLGLFGENESYVPRFYIKIKKLYLLDRYKLFIALYKNKAVASSLLYLSNNTAGIYHVATLPQYRNKGIGKQITLAPLLYAKEKGYKMATLQASKLGEIIYKKIGFNKYCYLGRYLI